MKESANQSISRAAEVLRLASASEEGITLTEIAEALGVSRPTAHNLATTLWAEDFLEKLEKPVRYRLGAAPGRLAARERETWRRLAARDRLKGLEARFPGAGWVYAEAERDDMRIIWRIDFKRPGVIERVDREVSHPYDTATALVFHAFADEPRAEAMRRRFPFAEFGRGIWERRKDFDRFLGGVRKRGAVAESWSDGRELGAVAAPVFDAGNRLVGSVGAFFPCEQSDTFRGPVLAAVMEVADGLGRIG